MGKIPVKHIPVGRLQSKAKAIDQSPIYYLAITEPVEAGSILRFDPDAMKVDLVKELDGYTEHKIIVNARELIHRKNSISYAELAEIAGKDGRQTLTVTWHKQGTDEGGTLVNGQFYDFGVSEAMVIFNVVLC